MQGVWGYEVRGISMNVDGDDDVIIEPGARLIVDNVQMIGDCFKSLVMSLDSESTFLLDEIPRNDIVEFPEVNELSMIGGGIECDRLFERLVDDGDFEAGVRYGM